MRINIPLILRAAAGIATTLLAMNANYYIGNIWIQEGLIADAGGPSEPMQLNEIIGFLASAAIATGSSAFTAAWMSLQVRSKAKEEGPMSVRAALRAGETAALTSAVIAGVIVFGVLFFGYGLLSFIF